MSEVRLLVRDLDQQWSGTIHASCADRAIAALSADPVTLEELEAATARFAQPEPYARFFGNLSPGGRDEPYDAGLVVIDLAARLVVVDSTYSSPGHTGSVQYHDGHCCTQSWLRYHVAEDWRFLSDGNQWRYVAEERRRERVAQPTIDARAVFYGRPLMEFIARECLAAFVRRAEIAAGARLQRVERTRARLARDADISPDEVAACLLTHEEVTPNTWPGEEHYAGLFYDTLSQIHAAWMLTPRDDLNGACPREIALERHDHISWDMQHRRNQWSTLGKCAPGVAKSSWAFCHGGFGNHELLKYYDLVRELLWSCWEQLEALANSPQASQRPEALSVGDFLTTEVLRLEAVREAWLDAPDPDCHGRTPRSVIDRERSRIPEAVSGREAMVDPDCPCCQMMADMPGPVFWHLDCCNNDDAFAFDTFHKTREEWDEAQRESEEFNRRFDAEWEERTRLGVTNSRDNGSESVWSRTYLIEDAEVPLGVRVFGLGCQLAKLIVALRAGAPREEIPPEAQRHIDQLNRDFGNLRDVLLNSDASLAGALVEPVVQCFAEDLVIIATDRVDVAPQCQSLADDLNRLLDPPFAQKPAWDDDDFENPF